MVDRAQMIRLAVVAGAALLAGAGYVLAARPAAPAPSLHSVWCVRQGYPADLAVPYVAGPGTGLAGCPAGMRQVRP